jgi:hypothetical protein
MFREGKLLDVNLADIHGQDRFNFEHAAISREDSKKFLDWAFWRDFEQNGPSLFRICRTTLEGWKRYKDHPDRRIRERFAREVSGLKTAYSGLLWAMERQLRKTNLTISEQIHALRGDLAVEFGWVSQAAARLLGPVLLWTTRREEKRLARGKTYEPKVIIEHKNWA